MSGQFRTQVFELLDLFDDVLPQGDWSRSGVDELRDMLNRIAAGETAADALAHELGYDDASDMNKPAPYVPVEYPKPWCETVWRCLDVTGVVAEKEWKDDRFGFRGWFYRIAAVNTHNWHLVSAVHWNQHTQELFVWNDVEPPVGQWERYPAQQALTSGLQETA